MKSENAVRTVILDPKSLEDILEAFDMAKELITATQGSGASEMHAMRLGGNAVERLGTLRTIVETLIQAAPKGLRIEFHAFVSAAEADESESSVTRAEQ